LYQREESMQYVCKRNIVNRLRLFNLGEMSYFNQHNGSSMNLNTISLAAVRTFTFVLSGVLAKMIFAVLEL